MAKQINTRIQLKIDTLSNWNASTFVPLAGEVCIAKVDTVAGSTLQPTMIKIGDGTNTFANLDWASAKAADVYAWAKEASISVNKDGTGNVVAGIEWDATANGGKGGIKFTTASVATAEGFEALQEAVNAINDTIAGYGDIVTHNAAEFQPAGDYKTKQTAVAETGAADKTLKISQNENGEITVKAEAIAIAQSQVTGLETRLTATENVANAAAPQATTYTKDEVNNIVAPLATTEALSDVETIAKQGVADAATAKGVADAAKARIDGFLDGTAEAESAIDTLIEIQNYMTSDTDAFTALSGRVTTAEGDIDALEGKVSALEGLVGENGKVENAENADVAAGYTEGGAIDTAIKAAAAAGTTAASNVQTGVENGTIVAAKATEAQTAAVANDLSDALDTEIAGVAEAKAKAAVEALDVEDTAVAGEYVSAVSETDGKISVTRAALPTYHAIATSGSLKDAAEATDHATVTDDKDYIIFNCGSSSINV